MEDAFGFADLLRMLSPLLAGLWLWALLRVARDLRRVSATRALLARCGMGARSVG